MKNESGFSLVEVLVAIVLVAVGLLGLLSMQTTAISGNRFSHDGTAGVQVTEYMIDLIRTNGGNNNLIYGGLNTSDEVACAANADCQQWRDVLLQSGLLNPIGTVTVLQNVPLIRSDTVEVTVTWEGVGGTTRSATLRTIIETWKS